MASKGANPIAQLGTPKSPTGVPPNAGGFEGVHGEEDGGRENGEEVEEFGANTVLKLTLLENFECKTLIMHLRASQESTQMRWLEKLGGRATRDGETAYNLYGIRYCICKINIS